MKISEKELREIIRESISSILLNEYGGEQLNLPFDGDSGSLNYEQYIDFVKSITKPGELTSNIRNVADYYKYVNVSDECLFNIGVAVKFFHGYAREEFDEYEYECVIGKLEDKYGKGIYGENSNIWSNRYDIGSELSSDGFRYLAEYLIDYGKTELNWMLGELFKYSDNGMIYINRLITIPKALGRYRGEGAYNSLYDLLNNVYGDLGYYWAYGVDTGGAYCANNFRDGVSNIRLIAMTPIDNIDMAETCALCGVGEHEVFFNDISKIMIVGLEIDGKKIDIGCRVCNSY